MVFARLTRGDEQSTIPTQAPRCSEARPRGIPGRATTAALRALVKEIIRRPSDDTCESSMTRALLQYSPRLKPRRPGELELDQSRGDDPRPPAGARVSAHRPAALDRHERAGEHVGHLA